MKKLIITLTVLASAIVIGCDLDRGHNFAQQEAEREQKQNDSLLAILADSFNLEKDEFKKKNNITVYPKNRPTKADQDAVWSCFTLEDGKPRLFRVIVQSSSAKSVPNTSMLTFNTDGRVSEIILQDYMKHESRNGNFYQIPSIYAIELLDSIGSQCSHAKMKASNLRDYTVTECKPEELREVHRMFRLYNELGGKIESPKDFEFLM